MNDNYVKLRFVHIVPIDDWHRYSVMLPVVETRGHLLIRTHKEICSVSFN